ncbi:MAG: T9SS type A sorting domain-containing protein, partial [Sediminibacterium sp.]
GKTYAVQTSPIYTYTGTNYQWGPVTYMCIIGSAGMVIDPMEDASQDSEKDAMQEMELSVFPNPTHGDGLTLSLSGITSDNVQVKVYDALGRKIESKRYVVDGTLQTELNFNKELSNGLYILEVTNEDVRRSVRFMVEQ